MDSRIRPMAYLLLTPIFFASVGINTQLDGMSSQLVIAAIVFVALSVVTKLVGCGFGAKLSGMTNKEALQTGFGMVCRGEVALIVANKGRALGLFPESLFSVIIIMVIATTILTPILLKLAFRNEEKYAGMQASDLVDNYEAVNNLSRIGYNLLKREYDIQRGRNPFDPDDVGPYEDFDDRDN
jgi:Kef-type K+ transport system membrane component KefB